jgi:hypothetical protein
MHYEQRWLDLVPALFDGVEVLRDPAYNVAHWNLPERTVTAHGDDVFVEGRPCRLFRFSGYSPDEPMSITKYSSRLTARNVGPARAVFERVRQALEEAGYQQSKSWPYAYGAFDNGVPVPDLARVLYLDLGDDAARFCDPLRASPPDSYFSWLNEHADAPSIDSRRVTRLWHAVYRTRQDLQSAFPDPFGADREAFLGWTAASGTGEHGIDERFLAHLLV